MPTRSVLQYLMQINKQSHQKELFTNWSYHSKPSRICIMETTIREKLYETEIRLLLRYPEISGTMKSHHLVLEAWSWTRHCDSRQYLAFPGWRGTVMAHKIQSGESIHSGFHQSHKVRILYSFSCSIGDRQIEKLFCDGFYKA